ncbi:NFX1-type zinc finger-containing protein 1 [Orbilia oligospora]|nr:NFX1-type zinc finger-containing protein 1 [Orbilia oligospora]
MENRNKAMDEDRSTGVSNSESISANSNSHMSLPNAIEREIKYEQAEADIRVERDSQIIKGATDVGAPVAGSSDPEPLELPNRKDILKPLTVNALRYIELSREHVDLPTIKLCFFIFEPVNATGPAVPYLCIRSFDINPRAPTMRIDIFPPSIRSVFLHEKRCSIALELNRKICKSHLPKELASNKDLSRVYKDVTTLRSVEVFFEPQKVGVLGKIRDFLLALEGKRTIICTDRNRSPSESMPSITTSGFLYQRIWEAAIQKEFEAEDEILKDRLGGQVELALSKEGNVRVFCPRKKEYTQELQQLGGKPEFILKFQNGESISAFCTADQVKEYNNSGLLELTLSKNSDKNPVIAETSPAGQFQLLPCTPVIRKQQQEFTLAEVVKSFDEDTPITGHDILWANYDRMLGDEIDPLLENCPQLRDLDRSQEVAFKHMLNKEEDFSGIVLISGPAGTGKTTTCASAIAATIEFQHQWLPILVVADNFKTIQALFSGTLKALGPDPKYKMLFLLSKDARSTLKEENDPFRSVIEAHSMASKVKQRGGKPEGTTWLDFKSEIIGQQTIVFVTIEMLFSTRDYWKSFKPQMLILDDATATNEMNSLLPWVLFRQTIQRFILMGDEAQLKPYSAHEGSTMTASLFQRFRTSNWPTAQLKINYRMSPEVSRVVKKSFYSHMNFVNHPSILSSPATRKIFKLKKDLEYLASQGLQIKTVDSYQGHEKEVVILLLACSHNFPHVGLLGRTNTLCFAMSRAKAAEIIVGDYTMMSNVNRNVENVVPSSIKDDIYPTDPQTTINNLKGIFSKRLYGKGPYQLFPGHVVIALCKCHEPAVKDSQSENREALSPESLVNFLAKSTPKEVERVSRNELKPGDYARLNDLKLIRERNALAHENWGKLAMILDTQEYSMRMHKQNYSRISHGLSNHSLRRQLRSTLPNDEIQRDSGNAIAGPSFLLVPAIAFL